MTEKSYLTADMHTHTTHSIDGKNSPNEMCKAAYNAGISVYNISDHCDVNRDAELHCLDSASASIYDALILKKEYDGRMKILAGIEIGNPHWNPPLAKKCAAIDGIDCVTGSVHRIIYEGEILVTTQGDYEHMTPAHIDGLNRKYFDDVLLMLDTIHPDILAHLTYMLRYIVGYHHLDVKITDYSDRVDTILKQVIKEGIALEMNTSILENEVAEYDRYLFERYFSLGGRLVTLGSDAHRTDRIASGFEIAAAELRRIGFGEACYIEKRQIHCYKI